MNWLRLHNEILDDPKVLRLSPEFRWFFVGILVMASRNFPRGTLPNPEEIRIGLRVTRPKAARIITMFIEMGFIDVREGDGVLCVHGWERRQYPSDDVTARTAAFRGRSRGTFRERSHERNGNVPLPRARDRDRDREDKKEDSLPSRPPPAPASGVDTLPLTVQSSLAELARRNKQYRRAAGDAGPGPDE